MRADQFIPGIEFKVTSERSPYVWKYDRLITDDGTKIHICYTGSFPVEHRVHAEILEDGIRFWAMIGDLYVNSRLIPFEEMFLVTTPVIA